MKRPNYATINEIRKERFQRIIGKEHLVAGSKNYYKTRPVQWIIDWGITYDPRNAGTSVPTMMPFILFNRQKEMVQFLYECFIHEQHGVIEKCRDYGATWVACIFSIWAWQYYEGCSIGWGSRKEILVDKLGDPDSIFEKMRMIINNIPSFCKPVGFLAKDHIAYMKIINPESNATITGEAGDNIGRGGRKTIYFKDESSHYEHPERIEASLGDNTNVQIDISSVNGADTIFQRKVDTSEIWEAGKKIDSGITRLLILDWRDHPLKNQEWYDRRRAKAEREGLLHIFLQEVDRDTTATMDGVVIPSEWIKSAIDAHIRLNLDISGQTIAGLDVADEGQDSHALTIRKSILLKLCKEWHTGDVGIATNKALMDCKLAGVSLLEYDCIGVGAGVKSETNRLKSAGKLDEKLRIAPWNAASAPLYPKARVIKGDRESPKNKDFYASLKSQGWWNLRMRFEKTHKAVTQDIKYETDELISIDSKLPEKENLIKQLSQATYTTSPGSGKMLINKKPKGSKSPNKADSVVIAYWPILPKVVLL